MSCKQKLFIEMNSYTKIVATPISRTLVCNVWVVTQGWFRTLGSTGLI